MDTAMTSIAEMFRQRCRQGSSELSSEEYDKRQCERLNALPGNLKGYDCPKCKNKGVVYFVNDGYIVSKPCSCSAMRESMKRIHNSGLQELMGLYTFDNFKTETPLQAQMKSVAQKFLDNHNEKWFFTGGQSGAGKSHICTALVGELLRRGNACRYMLWRDESVRLKAIVNDEKEYARLIGPLKTVPILYIDDLFKPTSDDRGVRKQPTAGDINLAFEIINGRYMNRNLITVISSEWTIEELQRVEPATGGRIYQRAKGYCLTITPGKEKNYRLR